ncbi:unnamed protein product [Polarella glacialis]|uniref:Uncharacterized protein n=1 Tax=Polarella glacialis TaxID=89957 RepID=A0A813LF44_POLGL|nr:unnamed protein product [Polarella glacialis]
MNNGVAKLAPGPPLKFDEKVWLRVVSFLYTHELLGRFSVLSAGLAALLADERCWSTLALPAGPKRVGRLLQLLVEERQLWAPLLRRSVRLLDLDLQGCDARATALLRELLLHSLGLDGQDGALCELWLRHLPASPLQPVAAAAERSAAEESASGPLGGGAFASSTAQAALAAGARDHQLMTLVNPVRSAVPSVPRLFLLDPKELGRLRFLMWGFFSFELTPSQPGLANNDGPPPAASLDLYAKRAAACPVLQPGWKASPECPDLAARLVEQELGALRQLRNSPAPPIGAGAAAGAAASASGSGARARWWEGDGNRPVSGQCWWGSGGFESWTGILLPRYQALLAAWLGEYGAANEFRQQQELQQ